MTRLHPDHDTLRNLVLKNWDFLGKTTTTRHLYEKKLMVGYRRPKNLRDLIVRADVRKKPPKAVLFLQPKNKAKELTFPEGSKKIAPQKQSTMLDFLTKKSSESEALHGSTSTTTVTKDKATQVIRSTSLTVMYTTNQIRNKCIAKKTMQILPNLKHKWQNYVHSNISRI